jgi:NADPH-dependent F420 reductase
MKPIIGVLGGTGSEGKGLSVRWAHAGYPIVIGSRDAERARAVAAEIAARLPHASVIGADNRAAAERCAIAVLTMPFAAHRSTLESVKSMLDGKILVDVTVPLMPPRVACVQLPPEDSAAVAAQILLGPKVRVVSAFQNVSAHLLESVNDAVDCDMLICGDDRDAREIVAGPCSRGGHA